MRLYVEKAFGKELTAINGVTAKSCKSFREKKMNGRTFHSMKHFAI